VSFYLFRYISGEIGKIAPEMQHEVALAKWIALDEASHLLSYKGERDMIARAKQYVTEHPELQSVRGD
jgi:hypothetical protein